MLLKSGAGEIPSVSPIPSSRLLDTLHSERVAGPFRGCYETRDRAKSSLVQLSIDGGPEPRDEIERARGKSALQWQLFGTNYERQTG